MNLHLQAQPPFLASLGKRALAWDEWYHIFQTCLTAIRALACEDARLTAIFLICIGVEAQQIYRMLSRAASEASTVSPNATPFGSDSAGSQVTQVTSAVTGSFEIAVERLRRNFTPPVNKTVERHRLRSRAQLHHEGIEEYVSVLRELATHCLCLALL